MIISRAPYRISLFGGGSDYPEWYEKNGGKVLSLAIDKYCYVTLTNNPYSSIPYKVVWRHVELCEDSRDILHPAVRGAFEFFPDMRNVEIHYHGELPARSGIGSSSSFAVALLHAMEYAYTGQESTNYDLFHMAVLLERTILRETVGDQDQAAATFGGFHIYTFEKDIPLGVDDLPNLGDETRDRLLSNLFLIYTGHQRTSSLIARNIVAGIQEKPIGRLMDMVDEAYDALLNDNLDAIGYLLHESWRVKRSLSPLIEENLGGIYDRAIGCGALGGKALGCGGGGFMVFYVPEGRHEHFIWKMSMEVDIVPFSLDTQGAILLPN